MAAAGPGGGQPRGRAFPNQVAFELGQGCEHMEDELAARSGGVDRLLEAPEPNPTLGHAGDGVDEMPEGAAEAVQLPHDQGVTGPKLVQQPLEGGAIGASPAGGLDKHSVAA